MSGTLWLVPAPLDHGREPLPLDLTLPREALRLAARLRHWVVEDAKSARALLKRIHALEPLVAPLQELDLRPLPRPAKGRPAAAADAQALRALLAPALAGGEIGLLSEAGLPALADPGTDLVAAAHAAGLRVVPLAGASAIALAVAASGLHGQSFAFVGYLPQDPSARAARIAELEARSRREGQTQLAIETPYRNAALAAALLARLQPTTRLALASALTWPEGWCRTRSVAQWRADPPGLDPTHPVVFAWLAA